MYSRCLHDVFIICDVSSRDLRLRVDHETASICVAFRITGKSQSVSTASTAIHPLPYTRPCYRLALSLHHRQPPPCRDGGGVAAAITIPLPLPCVAPESLYPDPALGSPHRSRRTTAGHPLRHHGRRQALDEHRCPHYARCAPVCASHAPPSR